MYSDLYLHKHSSTPKILLLVAVTVIVAVGFFSFSSRESPPTRASQRALVQNQIVNVSPTQIGILWETDAIDNGWLIYGASPSSLKMTALDERDILQKQSKRRYHYALMQNLKPNTPYYYRMVSDDALISKANGDAFMARTLGKNSSSSTLSPIYGSVIETNGKPVSGAFALLVINNAYPIVTLTTHTGEWLLPLQYVVQKDTLAPIPLDDKSIISIQFFDDARRSLVRSTVDRSRPLPESTSLGNNYSFIDDRNVLSAQDSPSSISRPDNVVSIRYPLPNAVIPGVAPLIKGYGIPQAEVLVSINTPRSFVRRTTVSTDGKWSVSVGDVIPPGSYTLKIATIDNRGRNTTLSTNFTIIKSGEQVLGENTVATPSGTLTPTSAVSISPTREPTIITFTPQPTSSSALTPTVTPAPPVSGINPLPFITAGLGLAILGIAAVLLL